MLEAAGRWLVVGFHGVQASHLFRCRIDCTSGVPFGWNVLCCNSFHPCPSHVASMHMESCTTSMTSHDAPPKDIDPCGHRYRPSHRRDIDYTSIPFGMGRDPDDPGSDIPGSNLSPPFIPIFFAFFFSFFLRFVASTHEDDVATTSKTRASARARSFFEARERCICPRGGRDVDGWSCGRG